jgi:hypothetical protein
MESALKVAGGALISAVVMGAAWWTTSSRTETHEDNTPDAKNNKIAQLQSELLRMRKEVEGIYFGC